MAAFTETICQKCGRTYRTTTWNVERRGQVHCSRACRYGGATLGERVWNRILRGAPNECWEFQGTRTLAGYGMTSERKRNMYAHRVVYELTNGPIPKGHYVLHSCDNPPCCNPAHLRAGTTLENRRDADLRGRSVHKLTPAEVAEIRATAIDRRKGSPTSISALARKYGVARTTINGVLHNRTWTASEAPASSVSGY